MPWVMAAMTAAQMLQGQQNREKQMKMDEARIRYSPWNPLGADQMKSVPNNSVGTAQQGYAGITGQMQEQKDSSFQDKLREAQLKRLEMYDGKTRPGGSMMNEYEAPVRGYQLGGSSNGADHYMRKNPWSGF